MADWVMWPTKDGKAWIVAGRFEGTPLDPVLAEIRAAKIPTPRTAGGVPNGWEGVSDHAKNRDITAGTEALGDKKPKWDNAGFQGGMDALSGKK
jgi:hypothetical protein